MSMPKESLPWRTRLRTARENLGLTRSQLAVIAGVHEETIRSYETGRRDPKNREHLVRVLEYLELPRNEANEILGRLGFAPIRDYGIPVDVATWFGLHDIQTLVDSCSWPAFAINDLIQVAAANRAFQRLFGVDFVREYTDPMSRSLLSLATTPRFADRIANWDQATRILVAVWKGHFTRSVSVDDPTPHLAKILDGAASGDPDYLRRLVLMWDEVDILPAARRWFYPIEWRDDELGVLHFIGMVHAGDDPATMLSFNDWVPRDAASTVLLEAILARTPP